MPNGENSTFVLGIDLGASSVGWALIERIDDVPARLVRAGARVFDAAVGGNPGDLEAGREESPGKSRRDARLQRRQTWRRSRRLRRVFRLLQGWGLLPAGPLPERQQILDELDRRIVSSTWFAAKRKDSAIPEPFQVLPYLLRAAALEEKLEPHFLGRAFYHLAQRRGYRSNRIHVAAGKKDEERGTVEPAIADLRGEMAQSHARTLGEHLSRQAPTGKRVRQRYTARDMYEHEFEAIWSSQQAGHPETLTAERKRQLHKAIFFQRPLRSSRHLVGFCELEKGKRRAAVALLISQEFRLLQKVNDLRVGLPGEAERELAAEERQALIERLQNEGDQEFSKIRRLLGAPRNAQFNLERGGERRLPGNRTNAALRKELGARWDAMGAQEQDKVVGYLRSFQKQDRLAAALARKFGFDGETAKRVAEISLEPGYMSFSRAALSKLLRLMREGKALAEARKELYPEERAEALALLPPVVSVARRLGSIKNPAVVRALTELRKVVNAVVRTYGKPAEIRIELARDLRNSRVQRERMAKSYRENEKQRSEAAKRILKETGNAHPSRDDIQRALLWEECGGICPYTGKAIPFHALFGRDAAFDVEHILPLSRSLDSSFANLTLCDAEHNRHVKRKQAPWEAYSGDAAAYEAILDRVKRFQGRYAEEKLRRFRMTTEEIATFFEDFTERQLNDTRYATRVAADYTGLLYGGRVDGEGKRRVKTTAGQVTAILRNEWKLNEILKDGPTANGGEKPKTRDDHRHHAIDAIVTGLTDDGSIQALSRAAENAAEFRRRRFAPMAEPWPNFLENVRKEIQRMVVSHREHRRARGALHEETIYSHPIGSGREQRGRRGSERSEEFRVRKPLSSLESTEIEKIADDAVRKLVQAKLERFPGQQPGRVFSNAENLPCFETRDGRRIPIKKARLRTDLKNLVVLGSGGRARHVKSEANHHAEIFAEVDERGKVTGWGCEVVSLLEAVRRKQAHKPIVRREDSEGREFLFSLAPRDVLEIDGQGGKRELVVIRAVSQEPRIAYVSVRDARKKSEMEAAYVRKTPNALFKLNARKVRVSPIGEVTEAHD